MHRCEHCQAQLLDHLYDLLTGEEQAAVLEHLRECEACQAALVTAKAQQQLLAAASKLGFPEVKFEPPPVVRLRTALVPAAPARPKWIPWAIAASVCLLVTGSLAVPGGLYFKGRSEHQHAQAQADQRKHDARQTADALAKPYREHLDQIDDLHKKAAALRKQVDDKVAAARQKGADERIFYKVTGPETLVAGARNQVKIQTWTLNNKPVDVEPRVRLLDSQSRELCSAERLAVEKEDTGKYSVSFPRDLEVKANTEVLLEIAAKADAPKPSEDPGKPPSPLTAKLQLVAPVYLTDLRTDKPMYQPGEVVSWRSLTLERFSLKPPDTDLVLNYTIADPKGQIVFQQLGVSQVISGITKNPILGPDQKPLRGVGAGDFPIPLPDLSAASKEDGKKDTGKRRELLGGEYTLTVSEAGNLFPPEKRKFLINKYEKPRLKKELEFTAKAYGPGDQVVASCRASFIEKNMPVANQEIAATIMVDGNSYQADGNEGQGPILKTDGNGAAMVRFKLPAKIDKGDASLSIRFTDGANTETIVRPIPVVLNKLNLAFYPEGGDLVAGLKNRVYFEARTPSDKPADITGALLDKDGKQVAVLETLKDEEQPGARQGMGMFEFTPALGQEYSVKLESPASVTAQFQFPEVKEDGIVLEIPKAITTEKENIKVLVRSGKKDRTLLVGGYCRGRLLAHQMVQVKPGEERSVELKPELGVGGVFRVTVFEERPGAGTDDLVPVAERLMYRTQTEQLIITAYPDKSRYIPGSRAKVTLESFDEYEKLRASVLMVGVVDNGVLNLADEKTRKSMVTHFYLTTEVRNPEDLEHADFLLTNHPKAGVALDLLLGTQGWRRFAEQQAPEEFRKNFEGDADRLLAISGRTPMHASNRHEVAYAFNLQVNSYMQELVKQYEQEIAPLVAELGDINKKLATLSADAERSKRLQEARKDANNADKDHDKAVANLKDYNHQWRMFGLLVLGIVLVLTGVISLLFGIVRKGRFAVPCYLAAASCLVLVVVGAATFWNDLSNVRGPADSVLAERQAPGAEGERELREGIGFGVDDQRDLGSRLERFHRTQGADGALTKPAAPLPGAIPPPGEPGVPVMAPAPAFDAPVGTGVRPFPDAEGVFKNKALDLVKGEAKSGLKKMVGAELRRKEAEDLLAERQTRGKGDGKGAAGEEGYVAAFLVEKDRRERPFAYDPRHPGSVPPRIPRVATSPGDAGLMPFVVREYSHKNARGSESIRADFTETVYWHPVLVLPDGRAVIDFELSDSVTTYELVAYGYTLDGRLGAMTTTIESRLPFHLEPKVPVEITSTDKVEIPLAITNDTDTKRDVTVSVKPTGLSLDGKAEQTFTIDGEKRERKLFRFQPTILEGEASLRFDGRTEPALTDNILRSFTVTPNGFPVVGSRSDLLERTARAEVLLPDGWVKSTLKVDLQVYPSTLADLQKGLEALLREPNGCFEQTSTSNYPNTLILDYLKETDQAMPEVASRAGQMLDRGYQKLTSFECKNPKESKREGYEWFGGAAPPHEALTAYGLLQFRDMARVYPVDDQMLERTRQYLLAARDGKGGFKRNSRSLDSFGRAPENITNAYIVWALTESGKDDDLTKELNALKDQAKDSTDPYFLALVANSLLNRGQGQEAQSLLKKLVEARKADGHLEAAKTSITGSGGRDLQIETTSLTLLAWLKANRPEYQEAIRDGIAWLGKQRGGYGGFGSTQSTILALKALIAFTKANKKTADAGELVLYIDDKEAARAPFAAGVQEPISLSLQDADKHLKPGKNNLRVEITGENVFPYTLRWSYRTLKPVNPEGCPVHVETRLNRTEAGEGDTVQLKTVVTNQSGKGQGMTVAIIGLPGGLTLPEDMKQLKDLARVEEDGTKPGRISAWETRGRELILYWRDLAPDAKIELDLDLICRVPGEYSGPASRAYLYYNADHKYWIDPLQMKIKARD